MQRRILEELKDEFLLLLNVAIFFMLCHKCGFGCNCESEEFTIQRVTYVLVRLVFWRRPKRPEVKSWTAVGQCLKTIGLGIVVNNVMLNAD